MRPTVGRYRTSRFLPFFLVFLDFFFCWFFQLLSSTKGLFIGIDLMIYIMIELSNRLNEPFKIIMTNRVKTYLPQTTNWSTTDELLQCIVSKVKKKQNQTVRERVK